MTLEERVEHIFNEMVAIRRDLHRHPELGDMEFRTNEKIRAYLTGWGIKNETIAGTGVLAMVEGKETGKTVGIRADMDALPLTEGNDVAYKSQEDGIMHACGHDAHTAMVLGAAKILHDMRDELKGQVKFFFQPAEETDGGALPMIQAGCMENPKVDYILGLHVMPYYDTGVLEIKYDQINASSDRIFIDVKGKSGHGAYPHTAVDAIVVASHIVTALQSIVSRNTSPTTGLVVTIGTIEGGSKYNNVAETVAMEGTLRALDESTRQMAKDKIRAIALSVAEGFGAEVDVRFKEGYAVLLNNNDVVDVVRQNGIELLGKDNVKLKAEPSMGVDDFAYFLQAAPGAYYHIGCGNEAKGINAALHNVCFDIDEQCMKVGTMVHLKNTLALLEK